MRITTILFYKNPFIDLFFEFSCNFLKIKHSLFLLIVLTLELCV